MLYCDTAIEPNENPLYVATYNATTGGKLQKYIQGVNPDKVEPVSYTHLDVYKRQGCIGSNIHRAANHRTQFIDILFVGSLCLITRKYQ